jgi:hypothetical protein
MCPETFNLCVIAERILCRHQQQFSVNVGAGVFGDYLVRPQVSPNRRQKKNIKLISHMTMLNLLK